MCPCLLEYVSKQETNQTLACGFSLDFSDDKEPTEELGDKPEPPDVDAATAKSDLDDTKLPG